MSLPFVERSRVTVDAMHESDAVVRLRTTASRISIRLPMMRTRPRVVVAYQAERTLDGVLARVPASPFSDYESSILVIDDASSDGTLEVARRDLKARASRGPSGVREAFRGAN